MSWEQPCSAGQPTNHSKYCQGKKKMYIFKKKGFQQSAVPVNRLFPSILMTVVTDYSVHVIRSSSPGSALCVN